MQPLKRSHAVVVIAGGLFLLGSAYSQEAAAAPGQLRQLHEPSQVRQLIKKDRRAQARAVLMHPLAVHAGLMMALPVGLRPPIANRRGYGRKLRKVSVVANESYVYRTPLRGETALWALQVGTRALPRARKRRHFKLSGRKGQALAFGLVQLNRFLVGKGMTQLQLSAYGVGKTQLRQAIEAANLDTRVVDRIRQ